MQPLNERGGTKLKKEYSQQDVERILKSNAQIPESVDERIRDTYRELGLIGNTAGRVPENVLYTGKREKYGPRSRRRQSSPQDLVSLYLLSVSS